MEKETMVAEASGNDSSVKEKYNIKPDIGKFNFNLDWKFIKENIENANHENVDDSNWLTVSTPHTFNDVDTFDNFMEGGHNGERSMFTGITWYRKYFKLDEKYRDKKVFIEFEGVRQAADVYINGKHLEGKYENGFIPFGYDLTPYLKFGEEENVIAVMADNTFPYKAEGTDDVLSWHDSHWHPTHGGIYRNVYLHIKDKLHITLPLYSFLKTQGTYVYASKIKEESANITVQAEVFNEYDEAKDVEYIAEVMDDNGEVVLTRNDTRILDAGEKFIFSTTGIMENPHRWSPEFPYIYTVRTKLKIGEEVVDTQETPLGIRTFEFTLNQGFFINGRHEKLTGWGQRPTNEWAGLGAAYPNWMHSYIFQLMKDAGGNFIRWGHSAGAPIDIEVADKYGVITIQPGVDGEGSTIGGVYSDTSYQIRANAFRDLVIYYRNHPSILVWEGGNQSVPEKEAKTLKDIVATWDPFGMRAYAHRRSDSVMAKYIDLSIGTEGSWELRSKGKPIVEGEYNREEAARRVWDRYTPGYENYKTQDGSAYNLTSEEFARNQAKHFTKISSPAHSGGANWIFSDSTSHGRVYSEVSRASGVVDGVMLQKEAYHAIKAIYRKDDQVYIIGHWNYPEGTVKDIYVMSNAAKVELFVNGKSKGLGTQSDTYLFTFESIAWEPGEIRAVAYNKANEVIIVHEKKTTGKPYAVKLTAMTGPEQLKADGSDILLIDIEVIDMDGNRIPTYEGSVDFTLEGPAIWRGGYNSGKEGSTNHPYLDLEAGINRVAVRPTLTSGTIKVTANIEGLVAESITVESKPVLVKNGVTEELPSIPEFTLGTEPPIGDGPEEHASGLSDADSTSKRITDFSYSGICEIGGVKVNLNPGDLIFNDREYEFIFFPRFLIGSDYLQLASDETNYKALDLIHLTISKDADIFIAHDNRLERPSWLVEEYEETKQKMLINDKDPNTLHTLFTKSVKADTTLTLGGNQDETNESNSNMYVVFVKEVE